MESWNGAKMTQLGAMVRWPSAGVKLTPVSLSVATRTPRLKGLAKGQGMNSELQQVVLELTADGELGSSSTS